MTDQPDAVVVGAGIAGLAAARRLARSGRRVLVLEASPRLGGKLAGAPLDGLVVDVGAESVLVRRPEAPALMAELGLQDRVVHPTSATPRVYIAGRAVTLPPSAMGVPGDLEALAGLLSPAGLARARQEPTLPAPALSDDVAIGTLADERFGPEVTDRLLEPLLGGVYAGHARRLSFAAVNPTLFARARAGGPLSRHAAATRRPGDGPVFGGLAGGVATLVEALAADLAAHGVEIRRDATVRALVRGHGPGAGGGYRLTVGSTRDAHPVSAPAVVLAVPAAAAGRLLDGLLGPEPAIERLAAIPYASMAVVALAVRGVQPVGSGLLVPPGELPTVKAVTHSSVKWAWLAEAAQQAWGEDVHVVRASVGRQGEERLLQRSDEELVERTVAELRGLPGWDRVQVLSATVRRWGGGLPQYEVGHRDLVAGVQATLAAWPGLAVCGAAYDGVGIAACLGSAERAVTKITSEAAGDPVGETVGRQT